MSGIALEGPFTKAQPAVRLDPGQKELVVQYAGLEPDQEYTMTLTGQAVRDLVGQPIDQRPSNPASAKPTMCVDNPVEIGRASCRERV